MFRDARMPSTHTPEHTHTLVRFIHSVGAGCRIEWAQPLHRGEKR